MISKSKKFKVFLCLPMSGRTEEDIVKEMAEMKNASIHYFQDKHPGCEIVYMTNYVSESEEESDNPVFLLGRGIMTLMAQADVCLFSKNWKDSNGCTIEHEIAKTYNIDIRDMGVDTCLANTAAFYHFGFKPKSIYRMESSINFDETSIEKLCSGKGTLERRQNIVDCIKNRTLLFPLGVLDRTETNDGYLIGMQPIPAVGVTPLRILSADIDDLNLTFKEVLNIEEDENED